MIRFLCHDFLNGKCDKPSSAECEFEHDAASAKPCQHGEECDAQPVPHYKRKWVSSKEVKGCQVCSIRFMAITPWRRVHHCRGCGRITCLSCLNRDYVPFPACTDCVDFFENELEKERQRLLKIGAAKAEIEKIEQEQLARQQQQQSTTTAHACVESSDDDGDEFAAAVGSGGDDDYDSSDDDDDGRSTGFSKSLFSAASAAFHNIKDLLGGDKDDEDENDNNNNQLRRISTTDAARAREDDDIDLLFRPLVGLHSVASSAYPRSPMSPAAAADEQESADISLLFRPVYLESHDKSLQDSGSSPDAAAGGDQDDDNDHNVPRLVADGSPTASLSAMERARRKIWALPPVLRVASAAKKKKNVATKNKNKNVDDLLNFSSDDDDDDGDEAARAEREETDDIADLFRGGTFRDAEEQRLEIQRQQREVDQGLFVNSTSRAWMLTYQTPEALEAERREQQKKKVRIAEQEFEELAQARFDANKGRSSRRKSDSSPATAVPSPNKKKTSSAGVHAAAASAAAARAQQLAKQKEEEQLRQELEQRKKRADEAVEAAAKIENRRRQRGGSQYRSSVVLGAAEQELLKKNMELVKKQEQQKGWRKIWKRFGVEMTMGVFFLAALVCCVVFLTKYTVDAFDMYQPCHRCIDGGGVFNESSQNCILPSNESSATTATTTTTISPASTFIITTDPAADSSLVFFKDFCGAPDCAAAEVVPGLVSTPYAVLLIGTIIGIINTSLVNLFKKTVLLRMKERLCGYVDMSSTLSKAARSLYFRIQFVGVVDPFFYVLLYCATLANLGLQIFAVTSGGEERFNDFSALQKIEAIYLRWISGGVVQITNIYLCQILNARVGAAFIAQTSMPKLDRQRLGDGERCLVAKMCLTLANFVGEKKALMLHWFLLPLPLLPITVTHVIPAIIIFAPVTVLLLGLYLFCGYLFSKKCITSRKYTKTQQLLWLILFRIVGNLCVLCLFQTMTGYSQLVYRAGITEFSWAGTIAEEYDRRSSRCWLNSIANKAQTAQMDIAALILL